ncbi:Endoribonuclease L-PSP/chorismate mutase-like protein [Aspergillus caelatus]|uniref:Endoribonuclease L-PSP/chorismate mutase-like protein n=1 Tax=Aspergillus caelatus TaxID=61420 RepID=A0A5N7AFG3_9EURO|nr:Endoribonuclease L-PSP/chorismate mutase-like protein [Aspergillus caelatus]KAE8367390.1 Endoribonuclease L-PSP/chorismate mutase-like protein [Aspergillus caelatus]
MMSFTAPARSPWTLKPAGSMTEIFTHKIPEYSTERHQHQCIKNLSHFLEAAGSGIMRVLKGNVFLSDMDNLDELNSIHMQYWGDVKPCRTYVAVKTLPLNTNMGIECIAAV